MEMLREAAPFLIGMMLPLHTMLLMRIIRLNHFKAFTSFVTALIVGCCVSLVAGELTNSLLESVMAIIIDTSLVYTGSQLTYHLLWKPILEYRLFKGIVSSAKTSHS